MDLFLNNFDKITNEVTLIFPKLEMQPAVGENPRHITLHMGSLADAKRALSRTSNKTKTSLFRLFKQTPEFEVGKDSFLAAVWVKLYKLPLHYFNEASLLRLGSLLGTVLRIHPVRWRSRNNDMQSCIEMDVSKPFTETLWIGTSKEYGWEVSVEYEGNQAYCDYCRLLGHTIGLCHKKRQIQGKQIDEEIQAKQPIVNTVKGSKNRDGEKWVAKRT